MEFIRYARACRNYVDFLYRARLLKIRLLERDYMPQDYSHQYASFMVVTVNWWIDMVYPSVPRKTMCSQCHSFPFLFRLLQTWHFVSILLGGCQSLKKQRTLTIYRFTWSMPKLLVVSGWLIYIVYLYVFFFGYFMSFVVSIFYPSSLCLVIYYFEFRSNPCSPDYCLHSYLLLKSILHIFY